MITVCKRYFKKTDVNCYIVNSLCDDVITGDLYKQSVCCCTSSKSKSDASHPAAVARIANCNSPADNLNAVSRDRRRRGTDFFPIDGSPKLIVETRTSVISGCHKPTNGNGDVVQSRVYLDVHDTADKESRGSISSSGGAVTFLVDNMAPDDKCSL
jgi:hypothetical protein